MFKDLSYAEYICILRIKLMLQIKAIKQVQSIKLIKIWIVDRKLRLNIFLIQNIQIRKKVFKLLKIIKQNITDYD